MSEPAPSVEQMCRALLTEAVRTELVSLAPDVWADPLPSSRTAGDLTGMANLLTTYLRGEKVAAPPAPGRAEARRLLREARQGFLDADNAISLGRNAEWWLTLHRSVDSLAAAVEALIPDA